MKPEVMLMETFAQPAPQYSIYNPETDKTRTYKGVMGTAAGKKHLNGVRQYGNISRWYPEHGLIDIDDRDIDEVEDIRSALELNNSNSFLFASKSPNSWHILIKPRYKSKPTTQRILSRIFASVEREHSVEVYPKANKAACLPFSGLDTPLFISNTKTPMSELIHEWERLQEYDLEYAISEYGTDYSEGSQLFLFPDTTDFKGWKQQGRELYEEGLQSSSSRNESQAKVLYYWMRSNIPEETAIELTKEWIRTKYNGYSQTILTNPREVYKEIERQARLIYDRYKEARQFPDSTHNLHQGFLSIHDIERVVKICKGSQPRIKFFTSLLSYMNLRHHRGAVNVHSDLLKKWSGNRTYLKYLSELEAKGILERSTDYFIGIYSKSITMKNWKFSSTGMIDDDRYLDYRQIIRSGQLPLSDYRSMLRAAGNDSNTIKMAIRRIMRENKGGTKGNTLIN